MADKLKCPTCGVFKPADQFVDSSTHETGGETTRENTPGQRLREAREALGLSRAQAAAQMDPPIGQQSWLDAEAGKHRSLDWWYAAAIAIGIDPNSIDKRLASTER